MKNFGSLAVAVAMSAICAIPAHATYPFFRKKDRHRVNTSTHSRPAVIERTTSNTPQQPYLGAGAPLIIKTTRRSAVRRRSLIKPAQVRITESDYMSPGNLDVQRLRTIDTLD